jgi:hypothetical protein
MMNFIIILALFINLGHSQVHKGPDFPRELTSEEVCKGRMLDIIDDWRKCYDLPLSKAIGHTTFNEELKIINDKLLVELVQTSEKEVGDFCKEHDLAVPSFSKGKFSRCKKVDLDEYSKKVRIFHANFYAQCRSAHDKSDDKISLDEVAKNIFLHQKIISIMNKSKKAE